MTAGLADLRDNARLNNIFRRKTPRPRLHPDPMTTSCPEVAPAAARNMTLIINLVKTHFSRLHCALYRTAELLNVFVHVASQ